MEEGDEVEGYCKIAVRFDGDLGWGEGAGPGRASQAVVEVGGIGWIPDIFLM